MAATPPHHLVPPEARENSIPSRAPDEPQPTASVAAPTVTADTVECATDNPARAEASGIDYEAVLRKAKRGGRERLPRCKVLCPCGVEFEAPVGGHRKNIQFHTRECRNRFYIPPGRKKKYVFTPEQEERIREVYRSIVGIKKGIHPVRDLAEELGVPRWRITRRAMELGIIERQRKEPNWSNHEVAILQEHAHRRPDFIQRHLEAAGFARSVVAIVLKKKRLGGASLINGYSACEASRLLGIDGHAVVGWIREGSFPAQKRGTARKDSQGGDAYFIQPGDLRRFIVDHVAWIDFRKLDKFWLVELLDGAGDSTGQVPDRQEKGMTWPCSQ